MDLIDQLESEGFVARPRGQLLNFPVNYRWEFTRRNPLYLGLWRAAKEFQTLTSESSVEDRQSAQVARFGLELIGVGGDLMPPSTSFEQLAGDDPRFLCGSLQPITIRSIVSLLLGQVSPEAKCEIGNYLLLDAKSQRDGSLSDQDRTVERSAILGCLMKATHADYDRVTDMPLFLMNLDASQETIKDDANRQAKLWKAKKSKGSLKIQTSKFPEYLEVWDQLEGWTGSEYQINSEDRLTDIANDTKLSLSTLHDRYRRAFECIIGRPFTPERWWKTMGRMKLALSEKEPSKETLRFTRRMMSRNAHHFGNKFPFQTELEPKKLSPKGALLKDLHLPEETLDIWERIVAGVRAGKTDLQIIDECDLQSPEASKLVQYVRVKSAHLIAMKE